MPRLFALTALVVLSLPALSASRPRGAPRTNDKPSFGEAGELAAELSAYTARATRAHLGILIALDEIEDPPAAAALTAELRSAKRAHDQALGETIGELPKAGGILSALPGLRTAVAQTRQHVAILDDLLARATTLADTGRSRTWKQ